MTTEQSLDTAFLRTVAEKANGLIEGTEPMGSLAGIHFIAVFWAAYRAGAAGHRRPPCRARDGCAGGPLGRGRKAGAGNGGVMQVTRIPQKGKCEQCGEEYVDTHICLKGKSHAVTARSYELSSTMVIPPNDAILKRLADLERRVKELEDKSDG
jgi:hypothetical protein